MDIARERQQGSKSGRRNKLGGARVGVKRKAPSSGSDEDDSSDDDHDHVGTDGNECATAASSATATVNGAARWHLVDFLVEANVSVTVFLQHLTSLFDRLLLDPELLEVTTLLKEEFPIATVLFEKYRVMWKKFALNESASAPPPAPERTELLFRTGWLLFLLMKRRLAAAYAGLGHLYYLLLAVLKLVISQVSPRSVEAEVAAALSALGAPPKQAGAGANGIMDDQSVLEMLCSSPKVDQEEVNKAYEHVIGFLQVLVQDDQMLKVPLRADDHDNDRALVRGIFDPSVIRHNASHLTEHYARAYLTSCGSFDERVYLNEQSRHAILGPRTPQPQGESNGDSHGVPPQMTTNRVDRAPPSNPLTSLVRGPMTPSRRDTTSSDPRDGSSAAPPPSPFTVQAWQWHGASPPPSLTFKVPRGLNTPITRAIGGMQKSPFVAQTPVTAAVETSNWIRDTLSNAQGFISPQLKAFFKECSTDPTDHIADVLQDLSHKLLTSRRRPPPLDSLTHANGSRVSKPEYSEVDGSLKKTKNLAVALFYRVVEALLLTERERLHTSNFSSLLNNETFISSLFACSLEVVLKAHSLITLSFPFLLETLGVDAFDFGKVIESFVKHVPKLPSALKRHMRDLEQMILDSLAWRSDSGLYAVLAGDNIQTPALQPSTPGASQQPAPVAVPRATVLQLFFRKVLSLAASRIFRLGNMMELEATYMNQVWTAIKECLSSNINLLKDRHLDQIILCSIYGVSKVNKLPNVTFNRIIECYKKLQTPQWGIQGNSIHANTGAQAAFASASLTRKGHDVIRDIKLDDDNTRGDVIKFYNRCYIPAMKAFLLQYQAQEKQMAAANAVVGGHVVTASTSDSVIVAEAAVNAVEKVMQSYGPPRTPVRRPVRVGMSSPPLFGSPSRSLPMFTTAEVESLPVSVHQTSPKRVLTSNIYMSPLQNARLHQHRTHMTPRSHALYAFGESPSRDLALINRAVNNTIRTAAAPPPLVVGDCDTYSRGSSADDATSGSNSNTPTNKRRRT